jgi:hypothetical protein
VNLTYHNKLTFISFLSYSGDDIGWSSNHNRIFLRGYTKPLLTTEEIGEKDRERNRFNDGDLLYDKPDLNNIKHFRKPIKKVIKKKGITQRKTLQYYLDMDDSEFE